MNKAPIIEISILTTTHYTKNIIGHTPIVKIHSIYNNTINLLINNKIFSLQPKNSIISPVSLITTLTSEQFKKISLLPDGIYQLNLNYQHCAIFYSNLTACYSLHSHKLHFYLKIAQQILLSAQTSGLCRLFQSAFDDLILSASQRYLEQTEKFYYQNDNENAAKTLTKMIGLGIGLTPSGDDFLCGVLATLQYFNQTKTYFYQQLEEQIYQKLMNTNPISSRFLECALEQQYSAPVLTFFQNSKNTPINTEKLGKLFENIGHSSGMDTLFGIYYACKLLINTKNLF